jgi:hypothetical protein
MSKAVVCTGREQEFEGDEAVTDVTIADGVTEIKDYAFLRCKGLTNLRFLKGSALTIVGRSAFNGTGVASLQWMEGVRKIEGCAFEDCADLRTIEGLGCEEMGNACFAYCPLLQSMKGWPASMTVIPGGCFRACTGMATVDCDLSHVTSIGVGDFLGHAFAGCTSLLPPSLSAHNADPATVLAFLKRRSFLERAPLRYAIYACVRRARDQEVPAPPAVPGTLFRSGRTPTPLAANLALLPPDMTRLVIEFGHGVVPR